MVPEPTKKRIQKILTIVSIVIVVAFFVALFCGVPTLDWTGWLLYQIFHWSGWLFDQICRLLQKLVNWMVPWL